MKKRLLTLIVIVLIFVIDYLTKSFASGKDLEVIKNFLFFTYTKNYGAAWSIFTGKRWLLIITGIVFLGVIICYSFKFKNNLRNNIAFGLIVGGLLGNLVDRICFGYVRDFISFKFGSYYYPVFNIADIAIVISVFLIALAIKKKEDNNGKNKN